MPVDKGGLVELSRQDLLKIYPFFGEESLFVDSLSAQKTDAGEVGDRAIGTWFIPRRITEQHFRDFAGRGGRMVEDLRLIPGHFWAEALGQALGALAYLKHPEHVMDVLPTFEKAHSGYKEAGFPGDRIDLCVELISNETDERGRFKLKGRGAAVFNERTLATVEPIEVRTIPLAVAMRALQGLRTSHQNEPRVAHGLKISPNIFYLNE